MSFRRLVPLVAILAVFTMALRFSIGPDTYWQLRAGDWMLSEGSLLRVDPFSITRLGSEWIYPWQASDDQQEAGRELNPPLALDNEWVEWQRRNEARDPQDQPGIADDRPDCVPKRYARLTLKRRQDGHDRFRRCGAKTDDRHTDHDPRNAPPVRDLHSIHDEPVCSFGEDENGDDDRGYKRRPRPDGHEAVEGGHQLKASRGLAWRLV